MTRFTFPHGETITRVQPGPVTDPFSGEPSFEDWDNPIYTEIPGCVLYPRAAGAEETNEAGRTQVQQTLTLLVPPGVELDPDDRVEWRGHTYEVLGFTFQYVNPFTGWNSGGQTTIRRIEG
jgi:hypothetical protein